MKNWEKVKVFLLGAAVSLGFLLLLGARAAKDK